MMFLKIHTKDESKRKKQQRTKEMLITDFFEISQVLRSFNFCSYPFISLSFTSSYFVLL